MYLNVHHHIKNAKYRLFITIKLFHQYLLNKRTSLYYVEGINAKPLKMGRYLHNLNKL